MTTGSNWLRLAAAGGLALAASPALAQQTPFTAQSSASETGTGEDAVQYLVNTTYAFDHVYLSGTDQSRYVLYEQAVKSEQALDAEAPTSDLTVTARSRGVTGYGAVLWTIHDNADAGEAAGDYYRTTLYGCCGAENVHRSYLAWTGKLVFTASADPLFAEIPNTPVRRAFAYLSSYAADGFDRDRFPRGVGLIAIVDGDQTADLVLLEAGEGSNYEWTPAELLVDPTGEHEMNGDTYELWPADGRSDPAGIAGFELQLNWDPDMPQIAHLPVVAGKFDLEHAVLPEGLTVRRLPAD